MLGVLRLENPMFLSWYSMIWGFRFQKISEHAPVHNLNESNQKVTFILEPTINSATDTSQIFTRLSNITYEVEDIDTLIEVSGLIIFNVIMWSWLYKTSTGFVRIKRSIYHLFWRLSSSNYDLFWRLFQVSTKVASGINDKLIDTLRKQKAMYKMATDVGWSDVKVSRSVEIHGFSHVA